MYTLLMKLQQIKRMSSRQSFALFFYKEDEAEKKGIK